MSFPDLPLSSLGWCSVSNFVHSSCSVKKVFLSLGFANRWFWIFNFLPSMADRVDFAVYCAGDAVLIKHPRVQEFLDCCSCWSIPFWFAVNQPCCANPKTSRSLHSINPKDQQIITTNHRPAPEIGEKGLIITQPFFFNTKKETDISNPSNFETISLRPTAPPPTLFRVPAAPCRGCTRPPPQMSNMVVSHCEKRWTPKNVEDIVPVCQRSRLGCSFSVEVFPKKFALRNFDNSSSLFERFFLKFLRNRGWIFVPFESSTVWTTKKHQRRLKIYSCRTKLPRRHQSSDCRPCTRKSKQTCFGRTNFSNSKKMFDKPTTCIFGKESNVSKEKELETLNISFRPHSCSRNHF